MVRIAKKIDKSVEMKRSNLDKKIAKLLRKTQDKCSICKNKFDDDVLTFTCTGLDKQRRPQLTSGCCRDKIVKVINIGVMGYYDPEDFEEIMKNHPLNDEFS